MFETKKTLIVVYKDEMLLNLLKKLVETADDTEDHIVGTTDNSIDIVPWTQDVWADNKRAGKIKNKVLFLDEIKGTDKLIPVLDMKLDEYGVKFGWAGNQAVIYAEPKKLFNKEDYDAFIEKLSAMPIPSALKPARKRIVETVSDDETVESVEQSAEDGDDAKNKAADMLKNAKDKIAPVAANIGKAVVKPVEVFKNISLMKRQMLFYGVVSMYNDSENGLEKFINN